MMLAHAWPTLPITDGRSYAAWLAPASSVRVLEDHRAASPDAATTFTAPPRCDLRAASHAALGYWCRDAALPERFGPLLQDPATGVTTVPAAAGIIGDEVQMEGDATWFLQALGTAAIEVGAGGNHIAHAEVRALDGTRLHRVTSDPRRVASLDAPGGSVALCAPLVLRDDAERRTARYRPP
jgi:hypothetical protein